VRYDLNTRHELRSADDLAKDIVATNAEIRKLDADIAETRSRREHDPGMMDREHYRLSAIRQNKVERLANLAHQYQQVWPADRSGYHRPTGGFVGSDS